MSTPHNPEQHGQTIENTANEEAEDLLSRAFVSEQRAAITHEVEVVGAILMAAHIVAAKMGVMETTQLEALRDIRDSLDCIGAHPEGDEPKPPPTAHESTVMYRALEEDYLQNHKAESIGQMDAMLRRFKRLAGC